MLNTLAPAPRYSVALSSGKGPGRHVVSLTIPVLDSKTIGALISSLSIGGLDSLMSMGGLNS